uniref:Uncharacterized protein n=1 Tax=Aegilops tauschii subsp. strangulata TaxID=200361 RepID=A0A452YA23_AEGTS
MAEAAFQHYDDLLGTAVDRDHTINFELIEPSNLIDLDAPFSEGEIRSAVKHLPTRKVPYPDGFTAEFLHACWSIVKSNF